VDSMLVDAIDQRHTIMFDYEGAERIVEPHCYGVTKKGKEAIRGYQVGGYSSSGRMGWRLFSVDKVRNLSVGKDVFSAPRPGYKRGDRDMETIYAQI
jgi:hypothetical protein